MHRLVYARRPEPELWDPFAGLYRCADGHVRVHTNFPHHRDGALRLLGSDPETATRADAEQALLGWKALDFEQAAANHALVATALRSFAEWDATPQGQAVASEPLMTITRIADAPPRALPPTAADERPLAGLRVLDLTRILAGPIGGRAMASFGADVMLVNSPNLPNIAAIAETSRGKRSAHIDLRSEAGREALWRLVEDAHVFSQGYRPAAWPRSASRLRPGRAPAGIVAVSLTAYGTQGPWAERRGFDSLVQTAMGFNHAEGEAAGDGKPRALPMQILDQVSGFLMAFGAAAALWRQSREGGCWHVQVSLAQTGHWLRGLGRIEGACGPAGRTSALGSPTKSPASAICAPCAPARKWREHRPAMCDRQCRQEPMRQSGDGDVDANSGGYFGVLWRRQVDFARGTAAAWSYGCR